MVVAATLTVSTPRAAHAGRDGIHRIGANMTHGRRPRIALLAAPETSASVLYGLYDVLLVRRPDVAGHDRRRARRRPARRLDRRGDRRAVPLLRQHPRRAARRASPTSTTVDAVVVCDMYTPIDTPPRGRFAVEIDVAAADARSRGALVGYRVHRLAAPRRGRPARRPVLRRPLGVPGPVRVRLPEDPVRARTRSWTSRARRDGLITAGGVTVVAGPRPPPDRAVLRPGACVADRQGLPPRGHEDGQLPFSAMTRRARTDDAVIRDCLAWIADNYATAEPRDRDDRALRPDQPDVRASLPGGDRPSADRLRPRRCASRSARLLLETGTRRRRRRRLRGGLRGPDASSAGCSSGPRA